VKLRLLAAFCFVAALAAAAENAAPAGPPKRPLPAVKQVVVIIVDGLRPDVLLLADAPTMHGLVRGGAYSFWARTTDLAVTLPSCTSMLTGVVPQKHGITWNGTLPIGKAPYPAVPTVFGMATQAGYVTALVAGKSKFAALAQTGTVTHAVVPTAVKISDEAVAAEAEKVIAQFRPALLCVHFPDVDAAGHAQGWGSPAQLAQITRTDAQIAKVLAALERAGLRDSTVVILSADHGGAGKGHGGDDARSRHIPWVVSGPGVQAGRDLTLDAKLQVRTEDTAATVCWLLGLPLPDYFDGHPVTSAFNAAP
jgi:predicted AlkP superfamily pyrophosphatase or phosphodiesterase